jgi:acetate kinase
MHDMNVLVLNCGSSSVKFQIIDTDADRITQDADRCLARGLIERIGSHAIITLRAENQPPVKLDAGLRDHRAAIDLILRWIVSAESKIDTIRSFADIHGVGHRLVHGGEKFKDSVRIDADVIAGIEEGIDLAPLHNPANLKGVRAVQELLGGDIPQVGVFDTAFHSTMPDVAFLYGIPYSHYRRHRIRRYGFHGTSHRYIAYRYRRMLGLAREKVNVITLHLGYGASACAIRGGRSIDTSMGFTPLEGLLMATRAGDLDASILEYLGHKEGMSPSELESMLNKQSGLLGVSGLTGDMRDLIAEVEENRDRRARLAIDMFCYRVRKYIGAYTVVCDPDAIIFTGGIGENSPLIRKCITEHLGPLGLTIDGAKNDALKDGEAGEFSAQGSKLKAYVIPTNEELLIARDTFRVVTGTPKV